VATDPPDMTKREYPLIHVRRIRLPWRDPSLTKTECGHQPSEFTQVMDHAGLIAFVRDLGVQRASMQVCMTCWNHVRAQRDGIVDSWDADPLAVVRREVGHWRDDLLTREFRVIAMLVAAHFDEFTELMRGLEQIVPPEELVSRRAKKRGRAQ